MWRTLDLLGVPRERCLPWTGWNPFIFDRFHYASPVAMTGDQESHSLTWLRHTVLHGFPEYGAATTPGRRIYLSRRGGRCREMLNEADLEPVIRARGFELIDPGKLSFDEQVRLFAEASVIVGPHGAAFTNMLWSRPGSVVCEIFEPSAIRRCYWSMAHTLGHRYHCAVAESVPGPIEPNMRLAPEALDHILRTVSSC